MDGYLHAFVTKSNLWLLWVYWLNAFCVTVFCSFGHWLVSPLRVTNGFLCSNMALSSPLCCGCLIEEHEGYTLCPLNNIVKPKLEPHLLLWPMSWICYLSTNESWISLCVCHWPQRFHHYEELALFPLCWLQSRPLTL